MTILDVCRFQEVPATAQAAAGAAIKLREVFPEEKNRTHEQRCCDDTHNVIVKLVDRLKPEEGEIICGNESAPAF